MPTVIINKFNGGKSEDVREQTNGVFGITKNFDVFSNPRSLKPRGIQVAANTGIDTTNDIRSFVYASNGKLYGLGVKTSASTTPAIFIANSVSGFTTWSVTTNSQAGSALGTPVHPVFFEHETYLYAMYLSGGTYKFMRYPTDDGAQLASVGLSVGGTIFANGFVHPADGVAYVPYGRQLATITSGTVSSGTGNPAIPINYTITGVTNYGNYLAVAAYFNDTINVGIGHSRLWLWNRDTSLLTFTENIDLGTGLVFAVANVGGAVLTASLVYDDLYGYVIKIQRYAGGTPEITLIKTNISVRVPQTDGANYISIAKAIDNKMYFVLNDTETDTTNPTSAPEVFRGLWCIEVTPSGIAATIDRNLTIAADGATIPTHKNFIVTGNYVFNSYAKSGDIYLGRTSASTYATATYDSQKFNGGDITINKKLRGVALAFEALPSGATITLSYRKDSETSFTDITSDSTQNDVFKEAVLISTGTALPFFHEIQFRITSTGGATPTQLKFKFDPMDTLLN